MRSHPIALIILDGYGYSAQTDYNAIAQAKKPTLDYLKQHYPSTLLNASGQAVGLPDGFIGNSEVGHMTLGAGRIIPSAFLKLHDAIANGSFFCLSTLTSSLAQLAQSGCCLHIIGLLSDAGVQCHQEIIYALIRAAAQWNVKKIVVHAILDGRDVAPQSAQHYLQALQDFIKPYPQAAIGSLCGRYFAMDRDNHWDRIKHYYESLVQPTPPQFTSWQQALAFYYGQSISDEFMPPTPLESNATITHHDGVIFANFREDRARELASCFLAPAKTGLSIKVPQLAFFISSIQYDPAFTNPVLIKTEPIAHTLKEILSTQGKSIFSIAETEKYAHITYFFGGGNEKPFKHETQMVIPSVPVKTYEQHPQMSAQKITQAVLKSLRTNSCDFYLINYANADMVGHSGNLSATIAAIEFLDAQIAQLYQAIVKELGGTLIITADHGNAELMFDEKTQQRYTAHTTNKVPLIWVKNDLYDKKIDLPMQGLADVAPFILKQLKTKS